MDVFISYRRKKGFIYAKTIFEQLQDAGINAFYDIKSLKEYSGEFTEELQSNIESAEFFIPVLTEQCFSFSDKNESIFLQEILHARKHNKTFIPVLCEEFSYPADLMEELSFLPRLQSVLISTDRDLESLIPDLFSKMIHTKNHDLKKVISAYAAKSVLKKRQITDQQQALHAYFTPDVKSLDICSFSCQALLRNARANLELMLKNGCKIRIIMNTPNSLAAKEAARLKSANGTRRQRERILFDAFEDLQDWISEYPSQIEYRTTELFLPCAIMILKYQSPEKDNIKIDYYAFNSPDKDRRSVLIQASDLDNFEYYVRQFEWIWNNPHASFDDD